MAKSHIPSEALTAIIIGAGIGGLAVALALAKKGVASILCERASALGEVGAGLQLSPNATKILAAWGLGGALDQVAFRPEALEVRGWRSGAPIHTTPLADVVEQHFGAPYLHIHRADLIAVLAKAVRAEPLIRLRLGLSDLTCAPEGQPAVVSLDGETIKGDLLIGADGIHSLVRQSLFGPARPRFTGHVAWRGLVPADQLSQKDVRPVAGLWLGPGAHFVHYYVRRGTLVNFVGIVEADDWQDESWTARGTKAQLLRDFEPWHPTVRQIVQQAPEEGCYRWALFDREPLPSWGRGAVTLMGDACHPTLPFMAQGACMALEDAAILSECLADRDRADIAAALKRYEGLRLKRTASIQLGSRRNAALYHLPAPFSWARDSVMRAGFGVRGQMDGLYGYDAIAQGRSKPGSTGR